MLCAALIPLSYQAYILSLRAGGARIWNPILCIWNSALTVGVIRNETLVFANISAQDALILKISVPIIKILTIPKHPQLAQFD